MGRAAPFLRIAHRGASLEEPEHTREAFERALELGVDMIEIDVQLTRDGFLAVLHDLELGRTVAGSGRVRDLTMERLAAMDSGAWMGADFAGRPVMELGALFELVRGRAELNIEIKSVEPDWPGTVSRMRTLLSPEDVPRVLVSSFHHGALEAVRRELPEVRIGVLTKRLAEDRLWSAAAEVSAWSVHIPWGLITPDLVARAHDRGLRVIAWTVNDPVIMDRLLAAGVDGIITDDPRLFAHIDTGAAGRDA